MVIPQHPDSISKHWGLLQLLLNFRSPEMMMLVLMVFLNYCCVGPFEWLLLGVRSSRSFPYDDSWVLRILVARGRSSVRRPHCEIRLVASHRLARRARPLIPTLHLRWPLLTRGLVLFIPWLTMKGWSSSLLRQNFPAITSGMHLSPFLAYSI